MEVKEGMVHPKPKETARPSKFQTEALPEYLLCGQSSFIQPAEQALA